MQTLVKKTSVSIEWSIWEEIKDLSNKSWFINNALKFYLARKKFIDEAEVRYWDNVEKSLLNNNWEYFSLNWDWEKITEKILEEKL